MHGLIFETSIWLLAGSTRFVSHHHNANRNIKFSTYEVAFKQLCCKCKQKRVTKRQRFLRKKLPRRRPVERWRKEAKQLPSAPNERSARYQHKSANTWRKSLKPTHPVINDSSNQNPQWSAFANGRHLWDHTDADTTGHVGMRDSLTARTPGGFAVYGRWYGLPRWIRKIWILETLKVPRKVVWDSRGKK